jgi:tetratricopeptide (TPR) repeat protein
VRKENTDGQWNWNQTTRILNSLASFLANHKRFDEAIAAGRRNVELDPLSKRNGLINSYSAARRFDEAIAELKAVIGLDPNYADAYYTLGGAYYGKGAYKEAAENWQKYLELDDDPVTRALFALAKAKTGNRDEAVKLLGWLKQESAKRYITGYAFAITYLALGEKEKALEWLEKDVDDRSGWGTGFLVTTELDDVRDEPRFKALLKRMNLPE